MNVQTECNAVGETKNICCSKGENTDNHNGWFKKIRFGCKDIDDQAKSGKSKSTDSEAVLWDLEANPESSTRRVSGKLDISLSSVIRHLHDLVESIWSYGI